MSDRQIDNSFDWLVEEIVEKWMSNGDGLNKWGLVVAHREKLADGTWNYILVL